MFKRTAKNYTTGAIFRRRLTFLLLGFTVLGYAFAHLLGLKMLPLPAIGNNILFLLFSCVGGLMIMMGAELSGQGRVASAKVLLSAEKKAKAAGAAGVESLQALLREYPEPTYAQLEWWEAQQPNVSLKAQTKRAIVQRIIDSPQPHA